MSEPKSQKGQTDQMQISLVKLLYSWTIIVSLQFTSYKPLTYFSIDCLFVLSWRVLATIIVSFIVTVLQEPPNYYFVTTIITLCHHHHLHYYFVTSCTALHLLTLWPPVVGGATTTLSRGSTSRQLHFWTSRQWKTSGSRVSIKKSDNED